MKVNDIAKILSEGTLLRPQTRLLSENQEINCLLTDSRNYFNAEGTLFFAINTPRGRDGHDFVMPLYQKGIRNFVVEYIPEEMKGKTDVNFFVVTDTLKALSQIGACNRGNAMEVVAITGSRGKTTLKEMIYRLLEPYKNISRSPRSYNSKIGVPLSLWQIAPDSELAIIEAGISQKGEMLPLQQIIRPDTVIFTNIGDAHSSGFASQMEKAVEKAVLAHNENVKSVIYPLDNELLAEALKDLPPQVERIRWSLVKKDAELFISTAYHGLKYTWKGKEYPLEVRTDKEYDIENIASALAFLLKEGISNDDIKERFKNLQKIQTRLNVSEGINGCSIILDSYTSDLSSLVPAIDFMNRRKNAKQSATLIISDLHHEGKSVSYTYEEIGKIVKNTGIQRFIGIGENIVKYKHLFPSNSEFFTTTRQFLQEYSAAHFNDEIILLKGSPEFEFKQIYEQLEARKHETVLEVNLDALLSNYNYFRSQVPSEVGVVAMVKASGYGSGSFEIAKTLQDAGASYLAVAALDEGVDLRNHGIVMPIMIMNPRAANYRALFKNRLEPVIYSLSMLETLIHEAANYGVGEYPVHIKLDTGMHRMGFLPDELQRVSELLSKSPNIKVASIFSHLATADCPDLDSYTLEQLQRFHEMSQSLIDSLGYKIKRHILNSAGILRLPQYHYEMVRLGIGLYGANTLPPEMEKPLATVSTLRSVIICIREIDSPETVGYSKKGVVKRKSRIATLPIGYADGIDRRFGNGALSVMINGQKAPTIGNICMDAMMVDVTDVDCSEGDNVEIFGENISVQVLADTLGTIPYEIFTSVSPRVKRIYYRE